MTRHFVTWAALGALCLACALPAGRSGQRRRKEHPPLAELRATFRTHVFHESELRDPAPEPPPDIFERVHYPAPLGDQVAYVSPARGDARDRPAIVWIIGGFDWGLDEYSFSTTEPRENDQTALAFHEAGIVMMRPALRGTNDNPGRGECFFGEVDDVLAAARFVAARPDVDPDHVYLGGHSTGGTMALLAAASSDQFRAVFSFGPVSDPSRYGVWGCLPSDASEEEIIIRSPIEFIDQIRTPTFVFAGGLANRASIEELRPWAGDAPITFGVFSGRDHGEYLRPACEILAARILEDTGPTTTVTLSVRDVLTALAR